MLLNTTVACSWYDHAKSIMRASLPEGGKRRDNKLPIKPARFESLVEEFSTKFVGLDADELDEEIDIALRKIVEFLDTDRSAIAEVNGNELIITHSYARSGIPSDKGLNAGAFSWFASELLAGRSHVLGTLPDDLPLEASAEREYCRQSGLRAIASVPIFVGRSFFGFISTASFRYKQKWPNQFLRRLKLIGEILANALTRQRNELEIKNQIAKLENQNQFERLISDLSAQFVNVARTNLDEQIEHSLELLLQFFRMDRMALLKVQDQKIATVTHSANAEGIAAAPVNINYIEYFPWHTKKLLAGEVISVHIKDLPAEAELDRKSAESIGIRSNLVIPLIVNNSVEYVFATNSIGDERTFDPEIIPRIRLLGEMFANALTRRGIVEQHRRAELEVQRNRQELAHISRVNAAGELSASIAHELNQPLTGILSNAQAALRFLSMGSAVDLHEIQEIMNDIVEDNKRASEVIRKLRSMIKKTETEFVLLDLNTLVGEVIELVQNDAVIRNVSISMDLAKPIPQIKGDRIQLQQVLLNLLLNALDELKDLAPPEQRKVHVSTQYSEKRLVCVSVADRGRGIPETGLTKIFDSFYTTKKDGLGMGLSIAKTIIDSHGGNIWAENNSNCGVTFHFTLPVFE